MEKQGILLHFCTCMVKGVSFFLLIVLSSMVSGTEKLIILLEIQENTTRDTLVTTHADRVFVTTLQEKSKSWRVTKQT